MSKNGDWALNRIRQVRDVDVKVCRPLLEQFLDPGYRYSGEITRQFMLGSAAFVIENPTRATDIAAAALAGVESTLKAYDAILRQKPEAKSKRLEDLKTRSRGKLSETIREQCADRPKRD